MAIPRTLREKLMQRREMLYAQLEAAEGARVQLLSGAVQSYTLGNRSISRTRAGFAELDSYLKALRDEIDEIEAVLSGRPQRASSVSVYGSPILSIPRFLA